jgi:hypothetical protein
MKRPEAKIFQSVQKLVTGLTVSNQLKVIKSPEVTRRINFILKSSDSKTFCLHHHSLILKTGVPGTLSFNTPN